METNMKDIFKLIIGQSPDLVIHTKDGEQVLGHSLVLSLHSPLVADIIAGIKQEGIIGITIQANAKEIWEVIKKIEKSLNLELSVDDNEVVKLLGIMIREQNWFPNVVNKELPVANNLDNEGQYSDSVPEKLLEEELMNIPENIERKKFQT